MKHNRNTNLMRIASALEAMIDPLRSIASVCTQNTDAMEYVEKRRKTNRESMRKTRLQEKSCVHTTPNKENESGKEDIPPTPPIGEKGKEKETALALSRARDEVKLPPVINVHKPPTLDELLAFAHCRADFWDDDFTRAFFQRVGTEAGWTDPNTGEPIRNWVTFFGKWRDNQKVMELLHDPGRIPDARKSNQPRADLRNRPTNYLAPKNEQERNSFANGIE